MTSMERANRELSVRTRKNLVQICIPTKGCKLGKCIFCNYGCLNLLTINEVKQYIHIVLSNLDINIHTLLLNACGSILDFNEVPKDYFIEICKTIVEYPQIETIIFETHYITINDDILKEIRSIFPKKNLEVELGLESIIENSQKIINKKIDLEIFKEKINIAHKNDFKIEANIFVGIPYLSMLDRKRDAIMTILWAYQNNCDRIVLFPCNLRKGTKLEELYNQGKYHLVSNYEIYKIIYILPDGALKRINVSWFGDWVQINQYNEQVNIPPIDDEIDGMHIKGLHYVWQDFFTKLNMENDVKKKRKILEEQYDLLKRIQKRIA